MIEGTQLQRASIANVSTSSHRVCWMSEKNMRMFYIVVFMEISSQYVMFILCSFANSHMVRETGLGMCQNSG